MTRISELPENRSPLHPTDMLEGERTDGTSERWPLSAVQATLLTSPTFTGNVLVPDANADGEALAYDQANWRLAGGKFTGNVEIEKASAALVMDSMTGDCLIYYQINGTTRKNVGVLSDGRFRIYDYDSARSVLFVNNGEVQLNGASAVLVPAISGANQAAQVTAYDATTGRLAIGGVEMGSTGVRELAASVENGWTATNIRIQRNNGIVSVLCQALNGTSSSSIVYYTLPVGFRPISNIQVTGWTAAGTTGSAIPGQISSAGTMSFAQSVTNGYLSFSFPAAATWPTSLPGTQITAPFS